ncbi:hypothetical protein D9M69_736470 [compost metagenome]
MPSSAHTVRANLRKSWLRHWRLLMARNMAEAWAVDTCSPPAMANTHGLLRRAGCCSSR